MRILFTGDKHYTNYFSIEKHLSKLINGKSPMTKIFKRDDFIFIQGGCKGVDTMVKKFAFENNITCETYEADWNQYGRTAGPIRNKEMLNAKPSFVIAFHDNIKDSKGTKNMITQALENKLIVYLIENDNIFKLKDAKE